MAQRRHGTEGGGGINGARGRQQKTYMCCAVRRSDSNIFPDAAAAAYDIFGNRFAAAAAAPKSRPICPKTTAMHLLPCCCCCCLCCWCWQFHFFCLLPAPLIFPPTSSLSLPFPEASLSLCHYVMRSPRPRPSPKRRPSPSPTPSLSDTDDTAQFVHLHIS